MGALSSTISDTDRLVAELCVHGVAYLSTPAPIDRVNHRPPADLIADCIRQPESRVRTAVIPLLLLHPEFAEVMDDALARLLPDQARQLKLFVTASHHLQRKYQAELARVMPEWRWLPDLFGAELGIPSGHSPDKALQDLGRRHQEITGDLANWQGTYENAAHHLIRRIQ